MDVLNSADNTAIEGNSVVASPSPMRKLLELHNGSAGMRENDSDLSESDELSAGRSRAWFYPSDHDEYGDEDDIDEDELEGEEGYYMDYDEEEENEGFDGVRDEDMDDEEIPSDEDMANCDDEMPSEATSSSKRQHRLDSIASESEIKIEEDRQDFTGSGSLCSTRRSRVSNGSDKDCMEEGVVLEQKGFSATADDVYGFSLAITQCLLAVLHDMDIQNVERSVISTVACVLEMAPSRLIRALQGVDVVLILDTVHYLLQGKKCHQAISNAVTAQLNAPATSVSLAAGNSQFGEAAATAHNSNLASFILAVRILQAMVRKSSKESSIFHQIERRAVVTQFSEEGLIC
ncbi:hypothetical protein PRIC1_002306 [Phytophthora ramorum]